MIAVHDPAAVHVAQAFRRVDYEAGKKQQRLEEKVAINLQNVMLQVVQLDRAKPIF